MSDTPKDIRYPYTYAADYVRMLAGYTESGTKLSRSDASGIRSGIAVALGIEDVELARKLADYYKANAEEIAIKGVAEFVAAANLAREFGKDTEQCLVRTQ